MHVERKTDTRGTQTFAYDRRRRTGAKCHRRPAVAQVVKADGRHIPRWLAPPDRAIVTELACYPVLHRERSISDEQLRWTQRPDGGREPAAKTMRIYLSMLRKALGPECLPSRGRVPIHLYVHVRLGGSIACARQARTQVAELRDWDTEAIEA